MVFEDAHVSGHACQEDIKLMYALLHPKYAVPVHGERRHLLAQAKIAESLGIPKDHIWLLHTGDVLELSDERARIIGKVQTGGILVDGLGVGDVGNIVIRDRQRLAEDGIIIVVMTLESGSGSLLAGPDLVSRGFVYVRESEDLLEEARQVASEAVEACIEGKVRDWTAIKAAVKDTLSEFVWKRTQRRPMILPIIMDVNL